jgi:thioredoxin-like negative regulator of GroEL
LVHEIAGQAVVAQLNVGENPRTAQPFGISGIPALLVFQSEQLSNGWSARSRHQRCARSLPDTSQHHKRPAED